MIATPQMALEAAASVARDAGVTPLHSRRQHRRRSARRRQGAWPASRCRSRAHGQPFHAPCVLLSGGETTVTVRGNGRGGRNVEFLLSLGHRAATASPAFTRLAGDTDGVDGQEEIAGALLDARHAGARVGAGHAAPATAWPNNDGHGFFEALGDAVVTGPDAHQRQRFSRHSHRRRRAPTETAECDATATPRSSPPLGPASSTAATIRALFHAGADVFRLNFSHGTHDDHTRALRHDPRVEREARPADRRAADLQGPKLRVGTFADGPVMLVAGAAFRLDLDRDSRATRSASLCRIRRFSPRWSRAPSCCSTTASCACGSTHAGRVCRDRGGHRRHAVRTARA